MAGITIEQWVSYLGLQLVDDPSSDKPVFRKPHDGQVVSLKQLDMEIAQRLRDLRKERQLSQAKVAKLLGMREATYARYESGKTMTTVGRLIQFFEVLNITPEQFFEPLVKATAVEKTEPPPQSVRDQLIERMLDLLRRLDNPVLEMIYKLLKLIDPRYRR